MTKKQPEPATPPPADDLSTAKLYRTDIDDLKVLASLMGDGATVADAYHVVCSRVVSGALAAAARERAAAAERDARRPG